MTCAIAISQYVTEVGLDFCAAYTVPWGTLSINHTIIFLWVKRSLIT